MNDERRRDTAEDAAAPARAPLTGDERSRFAEHLLPHLDAAYNLARHLMRDPDDAEDAVQEAALLAVRNFGGFQGRHQGGSARAWLLTIVRNACLTQMRRRRSRGELVPFDETTPAVDEVAPAHGPEADFVRTIAAEEVRREVDRLPDAFREALVLRELEGLSYREVAQVTGVPVGTVMSRLSRARRMLAAALTGRQGA